MSPSSRLPPVCLNPQLIYNYPEQLFADAGVMAIEHLDFEGTERLALVTGEHSFFELVWEWVQECFCIDHLCR